MAAAIGATGGSGERMQPMIEEIDVVALKEVPER